MRLSNLRIAVLCLLPFSGLSTIDNHRADGGENYVPLQTAETETWVDTSVLEANGPSLVEPELLTPSSLSAELPCDRLWLVNTRSLTADACRVNVESPRLKISKLNQCGRTSLASMDEYRSTRSPDRPCVIYVHGNRLSAPDAIQRGLFAYRHIKQCCHKDGPIDWVIWSWPSDKDGFLVHDARNKAARTDSQGLYLASVLRDNAQLGQPTALIGYSFGGRIISGAMHALAGGRLAGRTMPGEPVVDAAFDVGLVAPALQSDWMSACGQHREATKNIDRLILLYNRKDAVLKNFWRLNRIRNVDALGYTGPVRFAPRYDGSRLPVTSRDCSPTVGRQHREVDYYTSQCRAGSRLSSLISGSLTRYSNDVN